MSNTNLAGFAALEQQLCLAPVQPLTSTCRIGGARKTLEKDGFRVETFPSAYLPENNIRGQFEFGLKYDDLNLEWLSRFFAAQPSGWLTDWLTAQPTSAYARRTGFLYEWVTNQPLAVPDTTASSYEHAIDPARYLTSTKPVKVKRWKILDNLPGTRQFCPLVRLTPEVRQATQFDLPAELAALDSKFGADLLMRSAAWLTFNESRATFAIEHESDRSDDIQRFAAAMALHCGRMEAPLSDQGLSTLQTEVLGPRALRTGLRKSPVFVGSAAHHGATVVRYIAPDHDALTPLLEGLRAFDERTQPDAPSTMTSILRAGALAFGFVYIHPLADGNGRVHRLLVNDTLIRDGLVPAGVILPISSTIIRSSTNRGDYERTLDQISSRQIRKYAARYHFGRERVCEDGVVTDFEFDAYDDAAHLWRYLDLTAHCAYIGRIIRATVVDNMTEEASFLAHHDEAKKRLKRVYEMPDRDADAIIRSLRQNNGAVSHKLAQTYDPIFSVPEIAAEVLEAVASGLEGREMANVAPKLPSNRAT